MNPAIVTVGIGSWYPRGVARLVETVKRFHPDLAMYQWVNTYPPGSLTRHPYHAKPYAMQHAIDKGHDVVLWLDAAFYAIKPLDPLLEHIASKGYYFCDNDFNIGEWCADTALEPLGIEREQSFTMKELSSYAIGLDMVRPQSHEFVRLWREMSLHQHIFPGPHNNTRYPKCKKNSRNPGWCSDDPRVQGHRHDQTAASVIAHRLGMTDFTPRPMFTDYKHKPQHETTLLVNEGGLA